MFSVVRMKKFALMHDGGGCIFYHKLGDDLHLCLMLELIVDLLLPTA